MRRADFHVVLDACVMANIAVADLLLRLAETPRLYVPVWSHEILAEIERTLKNKLQWPDQLADSYLAALADNFPEACVDDYEHLLSHCANEEKDRHVLACAIRAKAEVIVTFNLKDFPAAALDPWQVTALHPQDYLLTLYAISPVSVLHRLEAMARRRQMLLEDLLIHLGQWLPTFCHKLLADLNEAS